MAARQDDLETKRIYPIPENFADGTGVLGGMFPLRNFIEGIALAIPLLLLALRLPVSNLNFRAALVVVLVAPPFLLGCIGINGDSVTEFLIYFFRYIRKRRVTRYNPRVKLEFTGDIPISQYEVPIEKLKKMLVNLSQKDRQEETESDRYFATGRNIAFEDDLALERKLVAKAERGASYGKGSKYARRSK